MSTSIRLRPWQSEALARWTSIDRPDFLAVATPGAGKTTFALTAAAQHLSRHPAARCVVVAPTQHLKTQWVAAAHRFGLHLDDEWSAADGEFPDDMHGVVTTYQQVATSARALRAIAAGAFVVLDEIHHAGDDRSWGEAVVTAFEVADRRLALSGTPFRSDTSAIPFVDYHLDEACADYEYGYGDALVDGRVVRPVYFPAFGGHMEWVAPDGEQMSASFGDQLAAQRANQRLRTALSLEGEWLPRVLTEAHTRLVSLRRQHPDAGGLVIAMDQTHAQDIAALMRSRFGVNPTVTVSDDPMASTKIARFAGSSEPWIVAVRMVSEGVDIPRLRLGVFATNTTTELFFRQAVGRLVRWTPGVRSQKAFLFIPDDPRLRRWANEIAEQRRHSLRKRAGVDTDDTDFDDVRAVEPTAEQDEQLSLFSVISATAEEAPTNPAAGGSIFSDELDDVWDSDDSDGEYGVEVALAVPPPPGASRGGDGAVPTLTRRQQKSALRARNSEIVQELVRFTNRSHREVNAELNRQSGVRRVTEATVEQLQRRLDVGVRWLRSL